MEQHIILAEDLIRAVLVNPPAVTFENGFLVAEEFSIGIVQVTHPSIGGTRKTDAFQVFNPLGEEVNQPNTFIGNAVKELVNAISNERIRRILDDNAAEWLACEHA